jgi:inner membrane transporter RhtA
VLVLPFGLSGAAGVVDRPSLLVTACAVALLSSVVSYGLELAALRRMPTQVFGILMSLEPAAAALAGLVVLGEQLGVREVVALVLVSVASGGITLAGRREGPPVQPLE